MIHPIADRRYQVVPMLLPSHLYLIAPLPNSTHLFCIRVALPFNSASQLLSSALDRGLTKSYAGKDRVSAAATTVVRAIRTFAHSTRSWGLVSGPKAFQPTSSSSAHTKEVMAVPNTRQRAKELVQQIAKNHGYLGEEKLRSIEPELRREIEEAFLKKDQMIGSSVIT